MFLTAKSTSILSRINYCYTRELCKTFHRIVTRTIRASTKELVEWDAHTVL